MGKRGKVDIALAQRREEREGKNEPKINKDTSGRWLGLSLRCFLRRLPGKEGAMGAGKTSSRKSDREKEGAREEDSGSMGS